MGAIRKAVDAWKTLIDEAGGPTKETLNFAPPGIDSELVKNTERMLAMSLLMGRDHIGSDLRLSDPADLPQELDPVSFDEAIRYFKSRVSMKKADWKILEPKLRFRAFTVARLSTVEAIEKTREKLVETIDSGGSLTAFWEAQSLHKLAGIPIGSPDYWETVYRTNMQTAYNTGRAIQLREVNPEYLEFVGVDDERQTTACSSRSGTVLPSTHPFWSENWPPLHFRCRSTVRGVFKEEVDYLKESNPTWERTPDRLLPVGDDLKGFGANPIDAGAWWRPVPSMINRAKSLGLEREFSSMAKEILTPEAYALVFESKSGGFVEIGMSHGKNERVLNLETAEALAGSGYKIKLLNLDQTDGVKTPDAFLLDGEKWEFKHPLKASRTAFVNAVANAKGQATRIVIRPQDAGTATVESVMPYLREALGKHSWVEEVLVILRGEITQLSREVILARK